MKGLVQAQADIELSKRGKYDNSLGYRLAVWDVGLHGIAQKPLFGHGTGVPESYFKKTVVTYKDGRYKDLPKFLETSHYHNDWIEIGMHIRRASHFGVLISSMELVSNPENISPFPSGSSFGMLYFLYRADGYFCSFWQDSHFASGHHCCCNWLAERKSW